MCRCPDVYCHFATGCHQHDLTYTSATRGKIVQQETFSLTVTISNSTISSWTKDRPISADVNNNEFTKMNYLPPEIDLFKNDFFVRIVQIIVSFIGLFVIVFTIFVMAYIYLKCFRKTTNKGEINEHQKNAQYKSLSFTAVEPESQTQPGPREEDCPDSTYLTPMFKDKVNSDTCHSDENIEIVQETTFQRRQNCNKPANDSNSTSGAGLANVYIEITQDNFETSSLDDAFYYNENKEI